MGALYSAPRDSDIQLSVTYPHFMRTSETHPTIPDTGKARLVLWNDDLAARLGIGGFAKTPQALKMWGGVSVPHDVHPVALAYSGHQFDQFAPVLGDGRAVLLGEVAPGNIARVAPALGDAGRAVPLREWASGKSLHQRVDIQLKGSGRTPFSRNGDGRATLRSVLREYVLSEAMHALGVPTTRALACVATGDAIMRRDESVPAAVLTRVSPNYIRVGTFQYVRHTKTGAGVDELLKYTMDRCVGPGVSHAGFLNWVAQRHASTIAKWMCLGFVHGVMNTDNCLVSGETIDYGPCAFLDEYQEDKVFSSIDRYGRYAYDKQPRIAVQNLLRWYETLRPSPEALTAFQDTFLRHYALAFFSGMADKLGLRSSERDLVVGFLAILQTTKSDFTQTFRTFAETQTLPAPEFGEWMAKWRVRRVPGAATQTKMLAACPVYIPRNHHVEHALAAADAGDMLPVQRLLCATTHPFTRRPEYADLEQGPGEGQRVTQTFCGT